MVSLVVTTCNRVTELEQLIVSLEARTYNCSSPYQSGEDLVVRAKPEPS